MENPYPENPHIQKSRFQKNRWKNEKKSVYSCRPRDLRRRDTGIPLPGFPGDADAAGGSQYHREI